MRITNTSALTGRVHTMELDVTEEQIRRWQAGELIQDVMPQLARAEREFLISGCSEEEWLELFGDGSDEAEDDG